MAEHGVGTRDPAPFLRARIAEDHAAIDAVLDFLRTLPISREPHGVQGAGVRFEPDEAPQEARFVPMVHGETEAFCVRFDPDRARHEAWSRAEIAELHAETEGQVCGVCVDVVEGYPVPAAYPCPTLIVLTFSYGRHADFDPAWADEEA